MLMADFQVRSSQHLPSCFYLGHDAGREDVVG